MNAPCLLEKTPVDLKPTINTALSIFTFSGKYVDLYDPQPETISIIDIAHHLSQINRFNGATRLTYSVAQHSIVVMHIVPKEFRLQALLHDAAEAYLGDMIRPVKHGLIDMHAYRDIESFLQANIYQKFGCGMVQSEECRFAIHQADKIALATERRDLMAPDNQPWPILANVTPLLARIRPQSALTSEAEFLFHFKALTNQF